MITCTNKLEEIQLRFMCFGKFRGIKIYTIKIRSNLITLNSYVVISFPSIPKHIVYFCPVMKS